MPKVHKDWTVLPHGPLEQIDEGLLTVAGDIPMPLGNFPRRMTVIGLTGGRTAIWSAMALGEMDMARIEALGRPSFLVVPSDAHRLDAPAWKARYPDIQVVTATGAEKGVAEVVPVDTTHNPFHDPDVQFMTVPGTAGHEGAMTVSRQGGMTLIVNDVIGHVRHPHGICAWAMTRLMGFGASGPQVPRPVRSKIIDDPLALGVQFRLWAAAPSLKRIIVSHGDPIADPRVALEKLAASLGA